MGCNCGKNKRARAPQPVTEDTPDPNVEARKPEDSDAWWQASPAIPPTAAVPMPS